MFGQVSVVGDKLLGYMWLYIAKEGNTDKTNLSCKNNRLQS